jgi:undecaprenyl-diphosphatase
MRHFEFELSFLAWLASFAGRWPILDRTAETLANNDLFEATPYVLVLMGFWYGAAARAAVRREIFAGGLAAAIAVLVCRLIQNGFASTRPIWDPVLQGLFPSEFQRLMDLSYHSFPSDHVAFILPLAYAVWRIDARIGAIGWAWFVLISVIRSYLALHYPIDLIAGALLGVVAIGAVRWASEPVGRLFAALETAERRWPGPVAAALFFVAFQYATLFMLIRDLGSRGLRVVAMIGPW